MTSWIGPWELFWLPIYLAAPYVALVFYLLNLQSALSKCSGENRKMSPGLVWLWLIPVFGFVWQFFVAIAVGKSLGSELQARGIEGPARPGRSVGIAAGVFFCISTICLIMAWIADATGLGVGSYWDENWVVLSLVWGWITTGLAALIVWIVYWTQVHSASSRLDPQPQWTGVYGWAPYAGPAPYSGMQSGPFYGPGPYGPAPYGPPPYGPAPYGPPPVQAHQHPSGDAFCSACGRFSPGMRFCPDCGREKNPSKNIAGS